MPNKTVRSALKGKSRSDPSRRIYAFLAVVGVGVFASALAGFLYSRNSIFMLSDIQVLNASDDLNQEVHRKLLTHLGKRLTHLSLSEIEASVQGVARVKTVLIHKKWPSSLQVLLEERRAVALAFNQRKLWRVDAEARWIDPLLQPEALPLIRNFRPGDTAMTALCQWLGAGASARSEIESVEWKVDRGLVVQNESQNIVVELGFAHFAEAWQRFEATRAYLESKNIRPLFFDAAYDRRVVVRLSARLQNFDNELNLKELVRRAEPFPAAAR